MELASTMVDKQLPRAQPLTLESKPHNLGVHKRYTEELTLLFTDVGKSEISTLKEEKSNESDLQKGNPDKMCPINPEMSEMLLSRTRMLRKSFLFLTSPLVSSTRKTLRTQ